MKHKVVGLTTYRLLTFIFASLLIASVTTDSYASTNSKSAKRQKTSSGKVEISQQATASPNSALAPDPLSLSCHPELCKLQISDELKRLHSPQTIERYEKQKEMGFQYDKRTQGDVKHADELEAEIKKANDRIREHEATGANDQVELKRLYDVKWHNEEDLRRNPMPTGDPLTRFVLNELYREHKSQSPRAAILLELFPKVFYRFHGETRPHPPDPLAHLSRPEFASLFEKEDPREIQEFNGSYWELYPKDTIVTEYFSKLSDSKRKSLTNWLNKIKNVDMILTVVGEAENHPIQAIRDYLELNKSFYPEEVHKEFEALTKTLGKK